MVRDINYEIFDDKCYVNVRVMKTSPLYKISTEELPLFADGFVKVISSNTAKKAPPSLALNKDFYKKWQLSENNKPTIKSNNWYLNFICVDRFEADKVIAQIHELEGMDSEERRYLLSNNHFLYASKLDMVGDAPYLKNVSEITVSLEMDPGQTSENSLKLICQDKKKRTLNKIFTSKNQYEGYGIRILGDDKSEVTVSIKGNNFSWVKMKYINKAGDIIERDRYGN